MPHHTQIFCLEFPIPIQYGSRYSRMRKEKKLVLEMFAIQHNTTPKMRVDGDSEKHVSNQAERVKTHAYDASRCALRMWVGHMEQLSTLLGLVGVRKTIPGLWRLSSTCFLLLNFLLFSFCSLGFYGGLTNALGKKFDVSLEERGKNP